LPLYEQVKEAMPVRDFVGHYVGLSHSGKGLCPFVRHVAALMIVFKTP
jgi:DNA primase